MPIYDFVSDAKIEGVLQRGKRGQKYARIKKELSSEEYQTIQNSLHERIDSDEIHTAGWIPGADWTGTPYQPLYEKAAHRNFDVAAMMLV